jgi:hypothetical protein
VVKFRVELRDALNDAALVACATTADANEVGVGVVAGGLAAGGFLVGLGVGHTGVNFFQDLLFCEAGVLQTADFGGAHGGESLKVALENRLDGGIRQADQAQHHRFTADGIEFVGAGKRDDFGVGIASALKVDNGVGAVEDVLIGMSGGDEGQAGFIADVGVFQLEVLRDFRVRGAEGLKLLDGVCGRAGFGERAVVGQRLLFASSDRDEDQGDGQESGSHRFYSSGDKLQAAGGVLSGALAGRTGAEDQKWEG